MCSIQLFSRSTFSLSVSNTGLTVVKVVFEPTEANFDFAVELAVRPFVRPTSVDGARGRRRIAGMSAARPIAACPTSRHAAPRRQPPPHPHLSYYTRAVLHEVVLRGPFYSCLAAGLKVAADENVGAAGCGVVCHGHGHRHQCRRRRRLHQHCLAQQPIGILEALHQALWFRVFPKSSQR